MRAKLAFSGSRGAIQGAKIATRMIARPTTPPASDSGLRRAMSASSRTTERSPAATGTSRTAVVSVAMASVADPRVEPGIGQIHEHVDHDEDHRVEQHQVLHHDDVALDD